uniref:Peptidyl-prolyl cis-trans isomerase n=1 Tax=Caenorhabditis japonica TaxID=281687 RepID=A0A8R1E609_CAEJA
MVEKRVFLDISIDENPVGRIEIKLFTEDAPKTCENFRALCTGEVGMTPNNKSRLHYKGNEFHRIVKNFMIQGGDITEGDGRGGYSIYGRYFDDEKFAHRHSKPYLLSMANKGPNSNSSQFFITTAPAPHCNGKHVVFGEVIRGQNVVDIIDNIEVDSASKPTGCVTISNCGELVKKKKSGQIEKTVAEKCAKEDQNQAPEGPKSWLYRQDERNDDNDNGRKRRRSTNREKADERKDDRGICIRGRGAVRYARKRSLTPDHWRQNAPIKLSKI